MKAIIGRIFTLAVLLILSGNVLAQFPITTPECATFDTLNNRYIVSSWSDNAVYSITADGTTELIWQNDGEQVLSNCISGDTLYVSIDFNPSGFAAFDLNTDQLLYEVPMSGTRQLDGMATDTSGYLYAADAPFNRIYRIDLSDQSWEIYFSGTAIAGIQDIEFDPVNNRLLIVGFSANSNLVAINLNTGLPEVLVDPPVGQFDGLTWDDEGNYYLSSWETNAVYRYGPDLTNPPELLFTFNTGVANIEFNSRDDILILPLFDDNELLFFNIYSDFTVDNMLGAVPHTVNFEARSLMYETVNDWIWQFGDGGSGNGQTIQHTYTAPGLYDVTIEADHGGGLYQYTRPSAVLVTADSLYGGESHGTPGESVAFEVTAVNTQPLNRLVIPISYSGTYELSFDSFSTAGLRSEAMPVQSILNVNDVSKKLALLFEGDLPAGNEPVVRVYFTISQFNPPGSIDILIEDNWPDIAKFHFGSFVYAPELGGGTINILMCGDVDLNGDVNVLDIIYLINFKFQGGPAPENPDIADVNGDGNIDILDIIAMINYKFKNGLEPEC